MHTPDPDDTPAHDEPHRHDAVTGQARSRLIGRLPMLAVAVLAAVAGGWMAVQFGPADDPTIDTASSGGEAENARLESLQADLENAVALPADFRRVPEFELLDVDAEPITDALFDDRWSLTFFGYTHCPDVCPITLQTMKNVVAEIESRSLEPMQVVFVSVDPARDTPEHLKRYVKHFDPDFIGVTGTVENVHALSSALGIVAAFTANDEDPDNYIVDHTASMLLVDPEGRVRAKFNAPHTVESIVSDYLLLRNQLS